MNKRLELINISQKPRNANPNRAFMAEIRFFFRESLAITAVSA